MPGKNVPRHLCVIPVVHTSYTRFRDYGDIKHKGLSFSPMNGVDEIFESGLTSNRCAGKSSCLAAALGKQWVSSHALTSTWWQLERCAATLGRWQTAYLSHRDKVGATTRGRVQAGHSPASSDVRLEVNFLKPESAASNLGTQITKVRSLFRGLWVRLHPVHIWGSLQDAH